MGRRPQSSLRSTMPPAEVIDDSTADRILVLCSSGASAIRSSVRSYRVAWSAIALPEDSVRGRATLAPMRLHLVAALLVGLGAMGLTPEAMALRSMPDTDRAIHVWNDQLPDDMTTAQVRFV